MDYLCEPVYHNYLLRFIELFQNLFICGNKNNKIFFINDACEDIREPIFNFFSKLLDSKYILLENKNFKKNIYYKQRIETNKLFLKYKLIIINLDNQNDFDDLDDIYIKEIQNRSLIIFDEFSNKINIPECNIVFISNKQMIFPKICNSLKKISKIIDFRKLFQDVMVYKTLFNQMQAKDINTLLNYTKNLISNINREIDKMIIII